MQQYARTNIMSLVYDKDVYANTACFDKQIAGVLFTRYDFFFGIKKIMYLAALLSDFIADILF